MDYKKFADNLKSGNLSNVYLLFGEQAYLLRFYLNQLISTVLNEQFKSLNFTKFSNGFEYEKVLDIVETYPVFDEKRIVLCENTGKFKKEKKDEKGEKNPDSENKVSEILEIIKQVPKSTILIFVESSVNKTKKEYKEIDKLGGCVEFGNLDAVDLKRWIAKQFKSAGRDIADNAVVRLTEYCSGNMDELSNEINKLINLVEEGEQVERKHIESITTRTIKTVVFDLTDALGGKNINKAMSVLEDMISLNEPIQKIFIMLSGHFRKLEKIRSMLDEGIAKSEIFTLVGIKNSFYGDKLIAQARRFSCEQLKKCVTDFSKCDHYIKTGKMKDRIAIELIFASLSK